MEERHEESSRKPAHRYCTTFTSFEFILAHIRTLRYFPSSYANCKCKLFKVLTEFITPTLYYMYIIQSEYVCGSSVDIVNSGRSKFLTELYLENSEWVYSIGVNLVH